MGWSARGYSRLKLGEAAQAEASSSAHHMDPAAPLPLHPSQSWLRDHRPDGWAPITLRTAFTLQLCQTLLILLNKSSSLQDARREKQEKEVSAGCGGPQAEQTLPSQPTGWGDQAAVPVHAERVLAAAPGPTVLEPRSSICRAGREPT